ncbi:MAG TPA: hypothetical protein VF895_07710 [Gaiellaceae bacterium]
MLKPRSITLAGALLVAALLAGPALGSPAAKPKKCRAGTVAVVVKGKRTCKSTSTFGSAAPGSNAPDMLIQLTARKTLWPRKAYPPVYKALGKAAPQFLAFDRALYRASRAVGKPFVPDDPTPPAKQSGDGDETLNLNIPAPVQTLLEKAERRQGGSESASGVQTKEAVTTGKVIKPPNTTGDYEVYLSEKFEGDPCPKKGGVVDGKATYSIERKAFLGNENVATVTVTFTAKVDKSATVKSYDLSAKLDSAEGGWHGSIEGKKLVPGRIPSSGQLSGFTVTGTSGLSPTAEGQVAAATAQALNLAKGDVDRWLQASQEIFKDRARCTKVDGSNLQKLKAGQTREIELDVRSIRGARTDDEIQVTGKNGLQVISPTGKAKATDGKLKVKVQGTKGHLKTLAALAQPYLLDVDSVSELGRGVGTLEIPRAGDYRFKGRLRENDFMQFGRPAGQVEVDFHVCGDPLADPWQGEATYVSEGDLLILATAWAFSAGAFTSPVDEYGNVFGILGSLDLEADPPVAHFQLKAYNGTLLTPTLELTDYDGCPP